MMISLGPTHRKGPGHSGLPPDISLSSGNPHSSTTFTWAVTRLSISYTVCLCLTTSSNLSHVATRGPGSAGSCPFAALCGRGGADRALDDFPPEVLEHTHRVQPLEISEMILIGIHFFFDLPARSMMDPARTFEATCQVPASAEWHDMHECTGPTGHERVLRLFEDRHPR